MNKIEKLFRKISARDRKVLLLIIEILLNDNGKNLDIKKLKGSDFYRLRKGRFRIIFHYDNNGVPIIDSIKLRDKDTYK